MSSTVSTPRPLCRIRATGSGRVGLSRPLRGPECIAQTVAVSTGNCVTTPIDTEMIQDGPSRIFRFPTWHCHHASQSNALLVHPNARPKASARRLRLTIPSPPHRLPRSHTFSFPLDNPSRQSPRVTAPTRPPRDSCFVSWRWRAQATH